MRPINSGYDFERTGILVQQDRLRIRLTECSCIPPKIHEFIMPDMISIGRRPENQVVIFDRTVSGRHCELFLEQNTIYARDLNSLNGTKLQDKEALHDVAAERKTQVTNGNILILGKTKLEVRIFEN